MKRLLIIIPIILLAISFANADNGFCFKINTTGKITDSWSGLPVNGTLYLETKSSGNYCLTFDGNNNYKISIVDGSFKFQKMVASPNQSCKFDIKIYSRGYLRYSGELWINGNQTNYTLKYNMIPSVRINMHTPNGNIVSGEIYINGRKYELKNGSVEFPNTKDIIWIYANITGYEVINKFVDYNYSLEKQQIVNITVYKTPKPTVSFTQNLSKTNLGEKFNFKITFKNPGKDVSKVHVVGNLIGCGLNKRFEFDLSPDKSKSIEYMANPEVGYCTATLSYKIQTDNSLISENSKELQHFVSDEYNITYTIKGNSVIAKVYDVNGNLVDTNVVIEYNGTKIKLTRMSKGVYYGTIPSNEFKVLASDGKNSGGVTVSGNFIKSNVEKKKGHIVGWVIIGALSAVTIGWIVYSRKVLK